MGPGGPSGTRPPSRQMNPLRLMLVCVLALDAFAQMRDSTGLRIPAAKVGIIAGRVVTGEGGTTPVRRAVIVIRGAQLPAEWSAITDDDGRFVFADVPVGEVELSASKPAYLTSSYGAARSGQPAM